MVFLEQTLEQAQEVTEVGEPAEPVLAEPVALVQLDRKTGICLSMRSKLMMEDC